MIANPMNSTCVCVVVVCFLKHTSCPRIAGVRGVFHASCLYMCGKYVCMYVPFNSTLSIYCMWIDIGVDVQTSFGRSPCRASYCLLLLTYSFIYLAAWQA